MVLDRLIIGLILSGVGIYMVCMLVANLVLIGLFGWAIYRLVKKFCK